jgi:hypothetical protein
MKDPERQEELAKRAKDLFDESVDGLDAATLSRLNQGRQRALAELDGRASHQGLWLRWVPVTGVAAAVLVTVMVINGQAPGDPPVTASDFEMLLEEESLEMLDDLEFYTWLELADAEADGNVG